MGDIFGTIVLDRSGGDQSLVSQGAVSNFERLVPFIYLVSDEVIEAADDWEEGSSSSEVPKLQGKLPWVTRRVFASKKNRPYMVDLARHDAVALFSPDFRVNRLYMGERASFEASQAALALACAGLEIWMPKFSFNVCNVDEVYKAREKLEEERQAYKLAIQKLSGECYERLLAGYYEDAVDWALDHAQIHIRPVADEYTAAMSKLNGNFLSRLEYQFLNDEQGSLSQTYIEKGIATTGRDAMVRLLKSIFKNWSLAAEERKGALAVYGFKLSSAK